MDLPHPPFLFEMTKTLPMWFPPCFLERKDLAFMLRLMFEGTKSTPILIGKRVEKNNAKLATH
jgi:hypothetical protein